MFVLKFAQINPALIFQNFINSGTGNTAGGHICCTSSLLMKCQYTISVDDALSAKPDTFQPGLLPSFVRTLQNLLRSAWLQPRMVTTIFPIYRRC
jgi:hypothetical protein